MADTVCVLCGADADTPACGCFEIVEVETPSLTAQYDILQRHAGPIAYCAFSGNFAWKCQCSFCGVRALVEWMAQPDEPSEILTSVTDILKDFESATIPTWNPKKT